MGRVEDTDTTGFLEGQDIFQKLLDYWKQGAKEYMEPWPSS